jgi:hypothetical protein
MTTKLTLSVEKTVIEKAKIYAKNTGPSLSDLVESYFESLTEDDRTPAQVSSKLNRLVGSVKLPEKFDEWKELDQYYTKKHL